MPRKHKPKPIPINPQLYPLTFYALISMRGVVVSSSPDSAAEPGAQLLPGFNTAGDWRNLAGTAAPGQEVRG